MTTEERKKRIEEQQKKSPQIQPSSKSLLSPFDPSKQIVFQPKPPSDGDMSNIVTSSLSTNIGRGGRLNNQRKINTKKNKRNLITRKNKKQKSKQLVHRKTQKKHRNYKRIIKKNKTKKIKK